ncbi:MAG TPA: SRPBCC domain-containing protein [Flavobacteriaceae bacterium]|nr:SRPBCC domain-containing protein [Flavobacteriaceae bacterium]MCB9213713.1 SRPBCC domain-containing protein [Alteromonas sp.]HPF11915.1 SRPBCC domain-containing protein [Flavobacteriaceae bacterium]HQU21909.1 SRPBCC domain-containing protein [Flavobacteriaceae bacterium]HQU65453.1 SRPBCC domain-containing protein [Flavobacteriaceae bacterium]
MVTLHFSVNINASKEAVWEALWNQKKYSDWAATFTEGTYVVTNDWEEGSKVHFLGPNGEGMHSLVHKHLPKEIMAFKHLGFVKDGKETPFDGDFEKWQGAMEIYTLRQNGNACNLKVSLDTDEAYKDYFNGTFPKALQRVKELSENTH